MQRKCHPPQEVGPQRGAPLEEVLKVGALGGNLLQLRRGEEAAPLQVLQLRHHLLHVVSDGVRHGAKSAPPSPPGLGLMFPLSRTDAERAAFGKGLK